METPEQKAERKIIIKNRMFYLLIGLDVLLAIFLVAEIIIGLTLIK